MQDRSDLSKLYPDMQNRKEETLTETIQVMDVETKLSFLHIFSIAVLLTMTVVMFILFSDFLNQNVDVKNVTNELTGIILLFAIWIISLIFVLLVTIKRLDDTGISKLTFIILYAICSLPITQITYNLYKSLNHGTVSILPLSGVLFIENLIFVFYILKIMNSQKMPEKVKNIFLTSLIVLCIVITLVGNIYIK
jgi:hypothetical protein